MMFKKLTYKLFICFAVMAMAGGLYAQHHVQATPYDELPQITPNKDNNDTKALSIAKTIRPEFFDTTSTTANVEFYARFIALDHNDPERFLIFTTNDYRFSCSNFGCPFYIYVHKQTGWELALSTQTLSLAHDPNTEGDNPDNIVTQNLYTGEITYEWSVTDGYYKKKGADK